MIALDLDGTTLNSGREVTDRTLDAFRRASEKGVHIVVSTGRPYTSLPDNVKSIPFIEYAITSNGAHINYIASGESVYDSYLSEQAIMRIAEFFEKLDVQLEVFFDGQAYMDADFYEYIKKYGCEYRSAEYLLWSRKPLKNIVEVLKENRDRIENVNFSFRKTEMLEEARDLIEAIPEATVTSSFPNNLEIGGPHTSKKAALEVLTGMLGVDRSELMCCGDAPNDIGMIEYAGLGVAVGNAWGGTKEHADYVTGTNDEDGVAQAIEKFVLCD
jgi:Cof subfamily protein (haloacid dehalogenase superfamily)